MKISTTVYISDFKIKQKNIENEPPSPLYREFFPKPKSNSRMLVFLFPNYAEKFSNEHGDIYYVLIN